MTYKSDVGDFSYSEFSTIGSAGPHAITNITSPIINLENTRDITYNVFNKVSKIEEELPNADVITLEIIYGVDDQRRQSIFTNSGDASAKKTKYFFGDYEEIESEGSTYTYHYVNSPTGLCAIYEAVKGSESDTLNTLWHVSTDHLGSITYLEDAEDENNKLDYSFTAWGISRDPDSWSQYATNDLIADRGYTGHEHLAAFGLINMNGRIYDPITTRFLSPDPYVQLPNERRGFNRYCYCLNNPLIYTDPSGEIIFTVLSAIFCPVLLPVAIGTDIGWITGGIRGAIAEDKTFWGGAWRGGLVGAVGGGLSMIGGAGMSFAANLALGTAEGAITGGLDAALWGNDIEKDMLWGAVGGAVFTTLSSENLSNALKGEGFYTNKNVFDNMIARGADKQDILNHFKFNGKYINEEGVSSFWYDQNDLTRFGIKYRNSSFDSYESLYSSYLKESFHMNRFAKKGLTGLDLGNTGVMGLDRWPEERLGAIHLYRNKGLIGGDARYLSAIRTSESWIRSLNQSLDYNPIYQFDPFKVRWWHRLIYNLPRRW